MCLSTDLIKEFFIKNANQLGGTLSVIASDEGGEDGGCFMLCGNKVVVIQGPILCLFVRHRLKASLFVSILGIGRYDPQTGQNHQSKLV